ARIDDNIASAAVGAVNQKCAALNGRDAGVTVRASHHHFPVADLVEVARARDRGRDADVAITRAVDRIADAARRGRGQRDTAEAASARGGRCHIAGAAKRYGWSAGEAGTTISDLNRAGS